MKTTLNIDDELLKKAQELSGIKEKTALIHRSLEELIRRSAQERLASLAGSVKSIRKAPRRKAG